MGGCSQTAKRSRLLRARDLRRRHLVVRGRHRLRDQARARRPGQRDPGAPRRDQRARRRPLPGSRPARPLAARRRHLHHDGRDHTGHRCQRQRPLLQGRRLLRYIDSRPELTHVRTRRRSPQTNGVVERYHGAIQIEHLWRQLLADGAASTIPAMSQQASRSPSPSSGRPLAAPQRDPPGPQQKCRPLPRRRSAE